MLGKAFWCLCSSRWIPLIATQGRNCLIEKSLRNLLVCSSQLSWSQNLSCKEVTKVCIQQILPLAHAHEVDSYNSHRSWYMLLLTCKMSLEKFWLVFRTIMFSETEPCYGPLEFHLINMPLTCMFRYRRLMELFIKTFLKQFLLNHFPFVYA